MSGFQHTPSPWILSEYEVRHPITLELRKGCEIFCKDNNRVVCEIPDYHFHKEDVASQSADARLLTVAPELLEALEEAISMLGSSLIKDTLGYEWHEKATAAIAKVRGES